MQKPKPQSKKILLILAPLNTPLQHVSVLLSGLQGVHTLEWSSHWERALKQQKKGEQQEVKGKAYKSANKSFFQQLQTLIKSRKVKNIFVNRALDPSLLKEIFSLTHRDKLKLADLVGILAASQTFESKGLFRYQYSLQYLGSLIGLTNKSAEAISQVLNSYLKFINFPYNKFNLQKFFKAFELISFLKSDPLTPLQQDSLASLVKSGWCLDSHKQVQLLKDLSPPGLSLDEGLEGKVRELLK